MRYCTLNKSGLEFCVCSHHTINSSGKEQEVWSIQVQILSSVNDAVQSTKPAYDHMISTPSISSNKMVTVVNSPAGNSATAKLCQRRTHSFLRSVRCVILRWGAPGVYNIHNTTIHSNARKHVNISLEQEWEKREKVKSPTVHKKKSFSN